MLWTYYSSLELLLFVNFLFSALCPFLFISKSSMYEGIQMSHLGCKCLSSLFFNHKAFFIEVLEFGGPCSCLCSPTCRYLLVVFDTVCATGIVFRKPFATSSYKNSCLFWLFGGTLVFIFKLLHLEFTRGCDCFPLKLQPVYMHGFISGLSTLSH